MRSVAIGLDLKEHFFDSKIDEKCHNLRLLSYPAIKTSLLKNDGQARAGAHSGEIALIYMKSQLMSIKNRLWYIDTSIPRLRRGPRGQESAHWRIRTCNTHRE